MSELEIKFRGKRLDNGEWVYGYLMQMHQPDRLFIGRWHHIGGEATIKDELFFSYREVDPETVGQYTGIKDENGKEIYKGDAIKADIVLPKSDNPYVVKWDKDEAAFTIQNRSFCKDSVEIIGNIHENPELLK